MARVDYWSIADKIRSALQADALMAGVQVVVEDELLFGAEATPWIGIYLDRRDTPAQIQRISAGRETTFQIRFSLWCWQYSLQTVEDAMKKRDDLVSNAELVLMKDRTFSQTVNKAWLEGGQMPSGRLPQQAGFVSGGEIIVVAEGTASN
jgi:hypothetical protein